MPFIFELYDKTNATREGQLSLIRDASAIFELEGENTLSFKISIEDQCFSSILERKYIRLVDDQTSSTYYSFIIQRINTIIDRNGDIFYEIQCEGLKYVLLDFMIASTKEYYNITATQALSLITDAATGWSNGTIDPPSSNVATIKFDFVSCLEALQRLVETWVYDDSGIQRHYYYKINEDKTIDLRTLANIGTSKNFYIHIDKQLRSFRKDSDTTGMANRVYGVGFDGFTIERAGKTPYELNPLDETATGGAVGYIEDTVNVDTDDEYNGLRGKIYNGTGSGQKFTVDDTIASTSRIEPIFDFIVAPDNTSKYRLGHAETGEDMTYDLGAYASDNNDATFGSKITVNFHMDAVDTSGSALFIIRVQALASDDSVIIQGSHRENMTDLSVENAIDSQIVLNVERNSGIQKLLLKCQSCNANGYVHFQDIIYSQAPNAMYIDDSTSQSTYGIVTGKYENPDIYDTLNLIKTSALDGTYSGGLCADWAQVGSPTLSENTNTDYIHHGIKSQKVISAAAAEGILQYVEIERDTPYSAYVRIYIDASASGSVELKIERHVGLSWVDTANHIIAGNGWVEVTIENFSCDDADCLKVSILSSGEASTFYVDAVMVHEGIEIHPFVDGDSADLLYDETLNYLKDNKDPHISYDLDLLDLYEKDPGIYANENFIIGDQIRVVDPDINFDSQLLVVNKQFNPLDPQECTVRLARKSDLQRRTFGKIIVASIRENRLV